ncbi:MAG: BlaI/MecI/CopY family transcriptional regulator [Chloroflexota bacterium]|nr:BlaI/MecI/CopY family transcriptional regulator [Chloroflexota bacterium]
MRVDRGESEQRRSDMVGHLLGDLEVAIMRLMWTRDSATVREILGLLQADGRLLAYTTVMTVMGRLAGKGLLARSLDGKTHVYRAAFNEQEFLRLTAAQRVQALVEEFGDLAIAQFMSTVEDLAPERRRQLEHLASGESP